VALNRFENKPKTSNAEQIKKNLSPAKEKRDPWERQQPVNYVSFFGNYVTSIFQFNVLWDVSRVGPAKLLIAITGLYIGLSKNPNFFHRIFLGALTF
jgi:hypothetical protein